MAIPTHRKLLLDLPNEILAQIIEYLDSHSRCENSRNWNLEEEGLEGGHTKNEQLQVDASQSRTALSNFRLTCTHACDLCEPAFCRKLVVSGATASEETTSLLGAREHRRHLVEVVRFVPNFRDGEDVGKVVEGISRLPNLKDLGIWAQGNDTASASTAALQLFTNALSLQLKIRTFTQLQQCHIRLSFNEMLQQPPLQIAGLLDAPKLITLRIEDADLRDTASHRLRRKSATIKTISLLNCVLDEQALVALLSWPAALTHLDFEPAWQTAEEIEVWGLDDLSGDLHILQQLLSTVVRFQPGLSSLKPLIDGWRSVGIRGLQGQPRFYSPEQSQNGEPSTRHLLPQSNGVLDGSNLGAPSTVLTNYHPALRSSTSPRQRQSTLKDWQTCYSAPHTLAEEFPPRYAAFNVACGEKTYNDPSPNLSKRRMSDYSRALIV